MSMIEQIKFLALMFDLVVLPFQPAHIEWHYYFLLSNGQMEMPLYRTNV